MKIMLESSSETMTFVINGVDVPARVWTGVTEAGVPLVAHITRIMPLVPDDHPNEARLLTEFERDLAKAGTGPAHPVTLPGEDGEPMPVVIIGLRQTL